MIKNFRRSVNKSAQNAGSNVFNNTLLKNIRIVSKCDLNPVSNIPNA